MIENDALAYAIEHGIIDLGTIQRQVEMEKKNRYLLMHEYEIWQLKDGRYATHIIKDGKRALVRKTKKEDLENYLIEYYKKVNEHHRMQDLCMEWLEKKLEYGEIKRQTYDKYERTMSSFLTKGTLAETEMLDITEDSLEDYIKTMIRDEEMTAKAWSGLRTIMIGTFKYAYKRKYTRINIVEFLQTTEISRNSFKRREFVDEEEVFTDEEIEMLTEAIEENPSKQTLGILLGFETGLRVGELSTLKYSDLDGNILNINRTEIKYKENGKNVYDIQEFTKGRDGHRKVILTDEAVELIKRINRINPFTEYLFETDGKRTLSQVFTNRLYRLCKRLEITPRSMHKARKTYASKLINANVPEKLVQKQLGHTDIATTYKYYHFNNLDIEESLKIIQNAIGDKMEPKMARVEPRRTSQIQQIRES